MDSQEILICTGNSFADSLSASAVGKPILLVGSALTEGQKAFLESSASEFIIIGGTNTVGETVENQLSEYGGAERLSGETRYETSVMVAERFFTKPGAAVLAYAKNFPDGLCGGPLAYAMGAPMILTATGSEAAADAYASENGITSGIVLGGNGLISDGSCQKIFDGNEHSHSYTKEVTAPTCEMEGYTTYTCSCGDSYTADETAALDHDWGDWKVTKEPTTAAEGQETRTCATCGATETRAVDKLPDDGGSCTEHSWGSWTSDSSGSYRSCTACGEQQVIDGSTSTASRQVVDLINEYRATKDLPALTYASSAEMAARIRAAELTVSFGHARPDGSHNSTVIGDYGLWGECCTGASSASDAVNKWIASSSHEPSLVADYYTMAVAAYNGVCWVVLFG